MNGPEQFVPQEKRTVQLLEEKDAAMAALEMVASLGAYSTHDCRAEAEDCLLGEICEHAAKLIPFKATAVYLVDEATQVFVRAHISSEAAADVIDREVDALIADQSFAAALQSETPKFHQGKAEPLPILLHALATPARIRGMFVGLLAGGRESLSDSNLKLLSVVMLSAAHVLASRATQDFMRTHAEELDRKVRARTKALEEAYERLRVTINGMQAGVLLIDVETRAVVDANTMALEMLDVTMEEVVGRKCNDFFCPAQEGKCPVLDQGMEMENAEREMKSKDGSHIPIQKTVCRIMIDGRPHLVESFIDITEQKKLADLREDVDRIMRHDLKAPLNGIIGFPDVILMEGDNLTESQKDSLGLIKSAGWKLLNMINLSLDLYKMETGRYKYVPNPIDLPATVRTVLGDAIPLIESHKLAVRVFLDGSPLGEDVAMTIPCEELLLYSLLSNLLKNAVEASPPHETVTLDIRSTGHEVVLSLHNRGAVPEEIRDTIFKKYSTSGKKEGTGLGTYSAKLIAETMGGSIQCASSEAEGTTMTVTLPTASPL